MNRGQIRRVERERVKDRRGEILASAWVGHPDVAPPPWRGDWLAHDAGAEVAGEPADVPVLVMVGSADSPVGALLLAHAQGGARVYVLAPTGWGIGDRALLGCPKVLIRSIDEVPASAVITGSGAHVWMGGTFGAAGRWRLRLDEPQARALRQVFLRLFWHDATKEAWTGGEGLVYRQAAQRPFDIPELSPSAGVRLVEGDSSLGGLKPGALVHLSDGDPPPIKLKRLWMRPNGKQHADLASLLRGGTEVVWDDLDLPDLATDGKTASALLPGGRSRLSIALTVQQAAETAALLGQRAPWSFGVDLRLGDYARDGAELWLAGAPAAQQVQDEQVLPLPEVLAQELKTVDETSPTQWPGAQPLALTARYRWTVLPPAVPAGAQPDALVGKWQKVDADWSARLAKARQGLDSVDGHRGRLGKAFGRLVGALMGFQRTQTGLVGELSELEAVRPSEAGPKAAADLLSRLAAVETRTAKLQGDLDDAEQKARDDEEREKQEAAWRSRVEAARRDAPASRARADEARERRAAIAEELGGLDAEAEGADKKARKDLKARRRKLSDDLARADKEIGRLDDETASREREIAEPFEFKPPSRSPSRSKPSGGRFVPTSAGPATSPVPGEALPEVGALRSHKGQRYLVIESWDQLSEGERAAERLRARLVAPEGA